jgi:hypothetical protein
MPLKCVHPRMKSVENLQSTVTRRDRRYDWGPGTPPITIQAGSCGSVALPTVSAVRGYAVEIGHAGRRNDPNIKSLSVFRH